MPEAKAWVPRGWRQVAHLEDEDGCIDIYTADSYMLIDVAVRTTLPKTEIPEYHYERSIYHTTPDVLAEIIEKLYRRSKYKLIKFLETLEQFADFIVGEVSDERRRCLLVPESAVHWYRLLRVSELRGFLCYKPSSVEHIERLYKLDLLPFHWEEYVPIILSRARKILDP